MAPPGYGSNETHEEQATEKSQYKFVKFPF